MNYHLMIDHFFIDNFIETAEEVAPKKNTYIFTFESPAVHIKSKKGINAPYGSSILKNIVDGITTNDRVYIHWFHNNVMQVIDAINLATPVYLFFWGGDFLSQTKYFSDFNLDPLTTRAAKKAKKTAEKNERNKLLYWSKNPLNYFRMLRNYLLFKNRKKKLYNQEFEIRKRFLNRLNYFCHWNNLDLEIIKGAYGCSPALKNFFYSTGFENIKPYKKTINNYIAIWLGNSDTEPNNHIDAINSLSRFNNNHIKIICPLSYGNKKYGDYISFEGQKTFAEKWVSLRDFIPLAKYLELFNEIDIVVMFHNRTQAAGNIFAFIKMGKKIYLKKQSTIFRLMKDNGIKVFDSNSIKDLTFEEFSIPLTDAEIQSNIENISNLFSDRKRLEYLDIILN